MFIRASRSGNHVYLRLVEGYRDEQGRTRHRQVAQLGRADQIGQKDVERLVSGLLRHTGADASMLLERPPEFEPSRELGAPWVLTELWRELGLDEGLRRALRVGARSVEPEPLVRAMVLNRLCDPESKLGVLRWFERAVLPGIETDTITHQQLLRAMDAIERNRRRFHDTLAARLKPLIDQELSIVFYDLTSIHSYGESELEDDLRRFGRSKDKNGVARQCVLGLIQTAEGLPLDFELFEGNIAEVRTLLPMLQRCLKRYPIRRVVVVADRGLISLDNVEQIEAMTVGDGHQLEYILAVPAGRYSDFAAAIDTLEFASEVPSVRETRMDGRRLVVAHDPEAAAAMRQRRREKIDELAAFGDELVAKLDAQDAGERSRGRQATDAGAFARFQRAVLEKQYSRFFGMAIEDGRFTFEVLEDAVDRAQRLDGKLVLLTNVPDLGAEDVVARYKSLADIERGFRVLKRDLEIAPVYHRLPERIYAHAAICFLALLLHRVMRMRLKHRGASISVERALEALKQLQFHGVNIEGHRLTGITRPDAVQLDLFDQLEVTPPTKEAITSA
ncbi:MULTISPECIES: IS1634 family transposase [Halorhodospira]|uniref:IS1634 family transposase n=1 Tax=Halorhodospira TaxID=85108 RepID=UPI001EE94679|nr:MULTISPECIES: IS1634 family transposase [Halorhodospira]MCG5528853.1 IS1634 family transposase [Halorhodospira halophila]MCG5544239.1 IS1634 family transposase [Halorhodospira sp. 9628]